MLLVAVIVNVTVPFSAGVASSTTLSIATSTSGGVTVAVTPAGELAWSGGLAYGPVVAYAAQPLVVAAPPKMLGALRDSLPAPLKSALLADMDKDLTNIPEADLAAHFEEVLAV